MVWTPRSTPDRRRFESSDVQNFYFYFLFVQNQKSSGKIRCEKRTANVSRFRSNVFDGGGLDVGAPWGLRPPADWTQPAGTSLGSTPAAHSSIAVIFADSTSPSLPHSPHPTICPHPTFPIHFTLPPLFISLGLVMPQHLSCSACKQYPHLLIDKLN